MNDGHTPSTTIAELRATAQGIVARCILVVAKKKTDNVRLGWTLVQKLYRNAEIVLAPLAEDFSLDGESETWPNVLRLAQAIVTACDSMQPPPGDVA